MSILVAVTGGSGSGKSTLAGAIIKGLRADAADLLSEDWYYRDLLRSPEDDPTSIDFDDISARDHDLLAEHLRRLRSGDAVIAPQYSFVHHRRESHGRTVGPAEVIVVEGAQLLCVPSLAALFDLRVYVDAPADVRFIRRLLRDQHERDRTVSSVVHQYLTTVRPAHMRLTGPSRIHADIIFEDKSCAVMDPDLETLLDLVEPALGHPKLAPFRRQPFGRQG